ncbi:class I SAM-dependent RNA methyltransferase [Candidatus Saccharibacteria bacterium]|nr:class I SAM-dependent RNA methyltransferase [Candidatus Saccharibacteria bacterium]
MRIDGLVPGGQGIGTNSDGKKGFFWNALPGETVADYQITKNKSSYFEAIATKIENPSPHRIAPKDDCYLSTSPWQIMDYGYELEQKLELLKEQYGQFGISLNNFFAGDTEPGKASTSAFFSVATVRRDEKAKMLAFSSSSEERLSHETEKNNTLQEKNIQTDGIELGYRNKMEYALYYNNEDGLIYPACRHRGTHIKFPITQSSLERPEIWAKCQEIFADLNARGEEARKYQTLLLRCNQEGVVSGGLLENGKSHPVFEPLKDTLLGHEYSYSPNGFFQINLPVYELALKAIAGHLGDQQKVLDLYAGVGTIGLSVARDRDLTLVELNGSAYQELQHNCEGTSAKPVLSASEEALEYIESDQAVIVDPPRAGLDNKLIDKLLEVHPPKIIYLSCNPATQARDAKKLLEKYRITSCVPFNFFPRTPHLENLLIFE